MLTRSSLLLLLLCLSGCVNGNNYPAQWSNAYCASLFACVDAGEIETWYGYDDEKECAAEQTETLEGTTVYDEYLEGDRTFDGEEADACIKEVREVQEDPDCGSMGLLTFEADARFDGDCEQVYPPAE